MKTYLIRRSLHTVVALILLVVVVFLFSHSIGDPVRLMLPDDASDEMINGLRSRLGLNDPLIEQFARYAAGLMRLDLGTSLWQQVPNLELIVNRLPATLLLAAVSILVATSGGIFLGVTAALRPGSALDRSMSVLSTVAVTSVDFWLALMLILSLSVGLGWLPTSGYGEVRHIVLPALVIAFRPMGRIAQVTRPAIIEELGKQYVVAVRGRGLSEMTVLKHAGRNAAVVLLTFVGYEFAGLVSGSAIIETVFAWPGVGFLLVQAVTHRDWTLIVGVTTVLGTMIVLLNFAIDLLYLALDPRIRYQ